MLFKRMALALAACLVLGPAFGQEKTVVRVAMNALLSNNLPIFYAIDKGYFADEGLEIEVEPLSGSTSAAIPLLARGDIDILPGAASPAFFNQEAQGFGLEIVGVAIQYAPGWTPDNALLVRQALWDSGEIKSVEDLNGHSFDIGPVGSPINFFGRQLEERYDLSGSTTITEKFKAPADWIAAFRNDATDAAIVVEPIASSIVKEGVAEKIGSLQDLYPDWQIQYIITSKTFAQANEAALVGFLRALLRSAKEIDAAGPEWTPDILATEMKWSGLSEADIVVAPPPHPATTGEVSMEPLQALDDYYTEAGLLPQDVNPEDLVNLEYLHQAQQSIGMK